MRLVASAALVAFAGVLTWGWKAGGAAQAQSSQGAVAREPVILELFTGEWAALFGEGRRKRGKRIAAFASVAGVESDRGNR